MNWGWCGEANHFVDRGYCGANKALSDELIIWGLLPYPRQRQPAPHESPKFYKWPHILIFLPESENQSRGKPQCKGIPFPTEPIILRILKVSN